MKVGFSDGNRSWWKKFPDEDSMSVLGGLCVCVAGGHPLINILHTFTRDLRVLYLSFTLQTGSIPSHLPLHHASKAAQPYSRLTAEPGSPRPQGCVPCAPPRFPWLLHSRARVAGRWHCVLTAEMAGGSGDPGCPAAALPGNSGGSTSEPAQASPKPSPTPPARGPPLRRSREQTTPHLQ